MSTVNLQALIDQVLGMTKETLALRNKKLEEGLSGHDQTEARNFEIQKEQNKNTAAQTLQAQGNEAAFARQGLVNTGQLEQAKERTAGEIARQGLANEGTRYTADQQLWGNIYSADKTLEGTKSRIGNVEGTIEAAVKGNPSMTADQIVELRQKLYDQGTSIGSPAPKAATPSPAAPGTSGQQERPPARNYDTGQDVKTSESLINLFAEPVGTALVRNMGSASTILKEAQNVPPPKSLQQQDADYFNRNKSAAGVVINPMLSPGESARMRMEQDKINSSVPKETEEERKKRQEQNRLRAGLS